MDKCCWDIVKFILFIVNLALLIFLGFILFLVVYIYFESQSILGLTLEPSLAPENPSAVFFSLLLIATAILSFLVLFAFLGCCGSATQNRCMLGSFLIMLIALLLAALAGMIITFMAFPLQNGGEIAMVSSLARVTMRYYDVRDSNKFSVIKQLWDSTQIFLECCGIQDYSDWTETGVLLEGRVVPASCCSNSDDLKACVFRPLLNRVHTQGCVSKMSFFIRAFFWGTPIFMSFLLVAAMIVYAKVSKSRSMIGPINGRQFKRRRGTEIAASEYANRYSRVPAYNPSYVELESTYPTGVVPPPEIPPPPPYSYWQRNQV